MITGTEAPSRRRVATACLSRATLMLPDSSSQSMKYGVAPTYRIALTVAANVIVDTGTTSPGPTPQETRARCSAAVPDDRPTP